MEKCDGITHKYHCKLYKTNKYAAILANYIYCSTIRKIWNQSNDFTLKASLQAKDYVWQIISGNESQLTIDL